MKGFVLGLLSMFALVLSPLLVLEAQTHKIDFAKLRAENVLAVNMSDEVIAFYLDPKQWPETISPAQKADYIQESLNLRIVHIDAHLVPTSTFPVGENANSWYRTTSLTNLDNYTTNLQRRGYISSFEAGSMYKPIYVNAVLPYQPGGNWSSHINMGVSYNGIRF